MLFPISTAKGVKIWPELLEIPEDVMQVALLPVGYTVGTNFKVVDRPAPQTITSFDTWGA